MTQLNTNELLLKFEEYTSDIRYSNFQDMDVKINQLFNFLYEQDISKRIFERISEDYKILKENFTIERHKRNSKHFESTKKLIQFREEQGALGFFIINEKFHIENKNSNHYIESTREWLIRGVNYNDYKDNFNTHFFIPFIELFKWYLEESISVKDNDYLSFETQSEISGKLDILEAQLKKLGFGQEIIFNELDDLKKLTKKLNKKNWNEIVMRKFFDLALDKVITVDIAQEIIKQLTDKGISLLQ